MKGWRLRGENDGHKVGSGHQPKYNIWPVGIEQAVHCRVIVSKAGETGNQANPAHESLVV